MRDWQVSEFNVWEYIRCQKKGIEAEIYPLGPESFPDCRDTAEKLFLAWIRARNPALRSVKEHGGCTSRDASASND